MAMNKCLPNTGITISMDNSSNGIKSRSEKVHNLSGEILPALVSWGTVIIVAIVLVLLLVVCFVPYPHSQGESILQHILFM